MIAPSNTRTKRTGGESQFPGRLHNLMEYVENQGIEGVISWVLNGRGFIVYEPDRLVEILPLFFSQTKYRSFRRQLNMWHFERVEKGPSKGAFIHPYFVRGERELAQSMSRQISLKPGRENSFGSASSSVGSTETNRQDIHHHSTKQNTTFPCSHQSMNQEDEHETQYNFFDPPQPASLASGSFGVINPSFLEPKPILSLTTTYKEPPLPIRSRNLETVVTNFANGNLSSQMNTIMGFEEHSRPSLLQQIPQTMTRSDFDSERPVPNFIQRQSYFTLEPLPVDGLWCNNQLEENAPLDIDFTFQEDFAAAADDDLVSRDIFDITASSITRPW